jgi:hypothetical protein
VSVPANFDGKKSFTSASKANIFKEFDNLSGWYFANQNATFIDKKTERFDLDSEKVISFTPSDIEVVLESSMQTLGTSLEKIQKTIDLKTVNNPESTKGLAKNKINGDAANDFKKKMSEIFSNAVKYM